MASKGYPQKYESGFEMNIPAEISDSVYVAGAKLEDGILKNVTFMGGCNGNTQGICKLVEGMDAKEVVNRLKGLNCNGRGTSCPDQLAIAITKAIED